MHPQHATDQQDPDPIAAQPVHLLLLNVSIVHHDAPGDWFCASGRPSDRAWTNYGASVSTTRTLRASLPRRQCRRHACERTTEGGCRTHLQHRRMDLRPPERPPSTAHTEAPAPRWQETIRARLANPAMLLRISSLIVTVVNRSPRRGTATTTLGRRAQPLHTSTGVIVSHRPVERAFVTVELRRFGEWRPRGPRRRRGPFRWLRYRGWRRPVRHR